MSRDDLPEGFRPGDPTARTRAHTDGTGVSFSVKEGGRGEPRIMIEEDAPGLPVLKFGDAFLMFHAREGVTLEQIEHLAAEMNRLISTMTFTKFLT